MAEVGTASGGAAPDPLAVLRGHASAVQALAWVNSGLLASADDSGQLMVWNLDTRRTKSEWRACDSALLSLSASSTLIATQGRGGKLSLWDVETEEALASVSTGAYTFATASVLWPDGLEGGENAVIAGPMEDETALGLWTVCDGAVERLATLTASREDGQRTGMLTCTQLFRSASSRRLLALAGYEDGAISLFDVGEGKQLLRCQAGTDTLLSVAWDDVIGRGLVGSASKQLAVVGMSLEGDESRAAVVQALPLTQKGVAALAVRSDGRIAASGGWDHRVRVWSWSKRSSKGGRKARKEVKPLAVLRYHSDSVYAVAFQADSHLLASAGKDGRVALWDIYRE
eukprot:PLAT15005.1.p1 GENE.PLAT15005.1~~PLAT15005.1.p1  ORF type:complete len:351 (-),score=91.77 PLAT15005.1:60-1088(-)